MKKKTPLKNIAQDWKKSLSILRMTLVGLCLMFAPSPAKAQTWDDLYKQTTAIAEAYATPCYLTCTNVSDVKNAWLKFINNGLAQSYFIIGFTYEGEDYHTRLYLNDISTLTGYNKDFKFNLANLTLSSLHHDFEFRFKIIGSGTTGGLALPSAPTYGSGNASPTRQKKTCSLCNGRGWIAGAKTPTYGNMGTKWCSDCGRDVPLSHSHDSCPSCRGLGYN